MPHPRPRWGESVRPSADPPDRGAGPASGSSWADPFAVFAIFAERGRGLDSANSANGLRPWYSAEKESDGPTEGGLMATISSPTARSAPGAGPGRRRGRLPRPSSARRSPPPHLRVRSAHRRRSPCGPDGCSARCAERGPGLNSANCANTAMAFASVEFGASRKDPSACAVKGRASSRAGPAAGYGDLPSRTITDQPTRGRPSPFRPVRRARLAGRGAA